MNKKLSVKSNQQRGGITAGVIKISKGEKTPEKPKKKLSKMASIATIVMLVIAALTFFGIDNMLKKKQDPQQSSQEIYNVKSENQSGGITAGKIENLNIFTDKESLGIREPLGLYRDGKKIGTAINPIINEKEKTFTFDEIQLEKPIPNNDVSYIFSPFDFGEYIIQVEYAATVVTMMPPGAKGVRGKIIGVREQ